VAGDYMSAASFLGIAGLIAFYGYDGFMYSVGWLVAYLTVLLLVAEPLRNTGRFTMADVLAFRFRRPPCAPWPRHQHAHGEPVLHDRADGGRRLLVSLLIPGIGFNTAIVGGRRADAGLRDLRRDAGDHLGADREGGAADERHHPAVHPGAGALRLLHLRVLRRGGEGDGEASARGRARDGACPGGAAPIVRDFTQPGLYYHGRWGALSLMSLGVALIFGTAGLPHILVRFYTVPSDSKAARTSVVWAMILIGSFYIMTTFLGFGAATLVGKANIGVRRTGAGAQPEPGRAAAGARAGRRGVPLVRGGDRLRHHPGGGRRADHRQLVGVRARHLVHVVKRGQRTTSASRCWWRGWPRRWIGVLVIVLAIALRTLNVAFLVGLAFAVAASANVPAILLTLYWRRFTTRRDGGGDGGGAALGGDPDRAEPGGDGHRRAHGRRHLIQRRAALPARQPGHRVGAARVPRRGDRRPADARAPGRRALQRAQRPGEHGALMPNSG
jgi:cation/acetate symporter